MRKFRSVLLSLLVVGLLAVGVKAKAQIIVSVGEQPVCQYGYYDYTPYACAPYGYYTPEYFYNGIFLGVGPWANWGYGHGWGSHRFVGITVGRHYNGGERGRYSQRGRGPVRGGRGGSRGGHSRR